jgi:hypothetical protein
MAKPPSKPKYDWGFERMKPGESKYFEGKNQTTIAQAFANFLTRGRYQVLKEGKGYRFHWLKQPKSGGKDVTEAKGSKTHN